MVYLLLMRNKLSVDKLLLLGLLILSASYIFTSITATPYNRFTHVCAPNVNQQTFDLLNRAYGPALSHSDQEQRFCPANEHPELTETWETINRYTKYTSYVISLPIILCTASIKLSRFTNQLLQKR